MGFLTRFIASGIQDDTARAEALAKHVKKVTGKCDSLKDGWDQPTKVDKFWLKDKSRLTVVDTDSVPSHEGKRPIW